MKKSLNPLITILLICMMMPVASATMPGLQKGDMAPDFKAATHEGGTVTLSDLYAKGPVVLIFYRGAWCPYCNVQLKGFQDRISEFQAVGASVVAVSVDLKEYANKTVQENALAFDVVSDPSAEILKSYGLIFQVPEDMAKMYKTDYKIDLEAHSGRKDHVIAIPGTYVIDSSGKIIFAFATKDYKVRPKPDEILEILKS